MMNDLSEYEALVEKVAAAIFDAQERDVRSFARWSDDLPEWRRERCRFLAAAVVEALPDSAVDIVEERPLISFRRDQFLRWFRQAEIGGTAHRIKQPDEVTDIGRDGA